VVCLTVLIIGQANASTYVPFTVSGTFTDPSRDTFALAGSFDVNATSGLVADASLQLAGEPWTNIISQGSAGSFYDLSIKRRYSMQAAPHPTTVLGVMTY
jgi:hypothetical protein